MALKNYTTEISTNKTVSDIHLILADHGAKKIMFEYSNDSRVTSISFSIATPGGDRGIRLPANVERVRVVLKRQKADPKNRNRSAIDDSFDQAERVAWRIVYNWLTAQMAILETEMVDFEQVFLPYFVNRSGKTLYELYIDGQLLLPE